MFGVTTACVTAIRERLVEIEPFIFHATGTGGRSMEQLVDSGLLDAVIDITTTEVADFIVGGIMPCTADRFGAVIRKRCPYVGSVGAVDMVNFGGIDTVPEMFRSRRLHQHNANVTLMRTTPEENAGIGRFIAERLALCQGPVRFLLPLGGVSAIDVPVSLFMIRLPMRRCSIASASTGKRMQGGNSSKHPMPSTIQPSRMRWLSTTGRSPHDHSAQRNPSKVSRHDRPPPADYWRGAGTGLSAKCEEAGGIDLIVIYNSGRYRMAGRGSLAGLLAYGNANEIVRDMGREVLPVVKHTPVLAGVNGTDPFLLRDPFLDELKAMGFSGIQNFPTVGLIDGVLPRQSRRNRHGLWP